jgi:hypothetical protein
MIVAKAIQACVQILGLIRGDLDHGLFDSPFGTTVVDET